MTAQQPLKDTAFWLAALTPPEAERARAAITEKSFPAGAYICHRGDRLDHWTGVTSGLVKISAVSQSGKAITFAGIGAGGWFGEGTVLKGEARQYDLVALRDSRLAMMNRATFLWLAENSVGFSRFLVRQLNERMGQFIATIENDRMHDPVVRVARHIAWLLNPVLYPCAGPRIEIGQEELALLAGLSRQVANRCLAELADAGLVVPDRGGLTVVSVPGLLSYGG